MRRFVLILTATLLSVGCSRDPNVLKKKYLEAGDRYFAKQKYREASILYRSAVNKDPRFGEAHYRNALALIRQNLFPQAEGSLRRAIELLPEGSDRFNARVQLADIYLAYMQAVKRDRLVIQDVDRLCTELLSINPNSFDGLRLRGTLSNMKAAELLGKRPAEAEAELRSGIADLRAADSKRPFQTEVVTALTRALWANNQHEEAEKYLKSLVKAKPDYASAYFELSHFYRRNNRPQDAEETLLTAARNLPKQYEFLAELAELYQRYGRRADMAKTLTRLKTEAADQRASYELSGRLFLNSGDPAQALREFEEGIRRFPKDKAQLQKLMVDALVAQNKNAEATRLNEEILRENPDNADALAREADFLLGAGEVAKAITRLETALQRTPNHAVAHYHLGRALLLAARTGNATYQFSEAIRWAPQYIPPRIALTKLELGSREFGKAVVSADAILELDSKHGEARVFRAMALRAMGKISDARDEVKVLLEMYPKYDEALFQLGELEAVEHKWKEAEAAYLRSYEANRGNIEGLLAIAELKTERNQADQAIEMLRAEVARYPDRLDLRLAHGSFAARAGRREEAAAEYKLLLGKLENNPKALGDMNLRLGELYFRTGDLQQAVPYLEKAKQLRPTDARILHSLGVAYDLTGRRKEAAALYEASLKINGQNPVVMNNLAYYISQHGGDLDQALTFAQRARQSQPNELGFSDTVAYIYFKKNLVENALEILEDLVSKKPNEAVFRMHLGEALLKKGDTSKAKKQLQIALSNKPSAEDTLKIKELLAKAGG